MGSRSGAGNWFRFWFWGVSGITRIVLGQAFHFQVLSHYKEGVDLLLGNINLSWGLPAGQWTPRPWGRAVGSGKGSVWWWTRRRVSRLTRWACLPGSGWTHSSGCSQKNPFSSGSLYMKLLTGTHLDSEPSECFIFDFLIKHWYNLSNCQEFTWSPLTSSWGPLLAEHLQQLATQAEGCGQGGRAFPAPAPPGRGGNGWWLKEHHDSRGWRRGEICWIGRGV